MRLSPNQTRCRSAPPQPSVGPLGVMGRVAVPAVRLPQLAVFPAFFYCTIPAAGVRGGNECRRIPHLGPLLVLTTPVSSFKDNQTCLAVIASYYSYSAHQDAAHRSRISNVVIVTLNIHFSVNKAMSNRPHFFFSVAEGIARARGMPLSTHQ